MWTWDYSNENKVVVYHFQPLKRTLFHSNGPGGETGLVAHTVLEHNEDCP